LRIGMNGLAAAAAPRPLKNARRDVLLMGRSP
jgi:hypothetical protein